jgi:hypothetical protein
MNLPPETQTALDDVVLRLKQTLGDNLVALVLYGSSVRGDFVPGVSDLDLLVVLAESTPAARAALAAAIRGPLRIDPFVLGRRGLERSARAFALKFRSIQRNHRVLHGADPFAAFAVDEPLLRFLTEQSLRNVRLRLVRAYVLFGATPERYGQVLARLTTVMVVDLTNVPRLAGMDVPRAIEARIRQLGDVLGLDTSVLAELVERRRGHGKWTDVDAFHARLFGVVDRAVHWLEERWPLKLT